MYILYSLYLGGILISSYTHTVKKVRPEREFLSSATANVTVSFRRLPIRLVEGFTLLMTSWIQNKLLGFFPLFKAGLVLSGRSGVSWINATHAPKTKGAYTRN